MPGFIKQMLIVLVLVLSCFGGSLTIKYTSMYIQPLLNIGTVVDMNLDQLHYHSFIVSRNSCDGICDTTENSSGRICVSL